MSAIEPWSSRLQVTRRQPDGTMDEVMQCERDETETMNMKIAPSMYPAASSRRSCEQVQVGKERRGAAPSQGRKREGKQSTMIKVKSKILDRSAGTRAFCQMVFGPARLARPVVCFPVRSVPLLGHPSLADSGRRSPAWSSAAPCPPRPWIRLRMHSQVRLGYRYPSVANQRACLKCTKMVG